MANITIGDRAFTLSATQNGTNTYILGDVDNGVVGTWMIHIVNVTSLSASIVVKARARGEAANTDAVPFVPISYMKLYLNGVVADNTLATTAITGSSIILVPASGLSIALDVTFTSGVGKVYAWPLEGAAV